MGSGLTKVFPIIPDKETVLTLMSEYDKLKVAGLNVDEMYHIIKLRSHTASSESNVDVINTAYVNEKSDDMRNSEMTLIAASATKTETKAKTAKEETATANPVKIKANNNEKKPVALLIDDSPVAAKLAARVVQTLNFDVLTTFSAESGFEILKSKVKEISIVFLDVVMPNVDGVECLLWIKGEATISHIPIYMLSGLDDETLSEVCVENGAEGMLLKPLNVPMLKEIMKRHSLGSEYMASDVPQSKFVPQTSQSTTEACTPTKPLNKIEDIGGNNSVSTDVSRLHRRAGSNTNSTAKISTTTYINTINSPNASQQIKPNDIHSPLNIGGIATAFRLIDTNFKEFLYPSKSMKSNVLLAFIPSIFFKELYEDNNSFLRWLVYKNDFLKENHTTVICISGDLPMALAAGKARFNLPFSFLGDPSLQVSKKYVGTFNLTKYLMETKADMNDIQKNNQQRVMAPHLGILLINQYRYIVHKWVGIKSDGSSDPKATLPDMQQWIKDLKEQSSHQPVQDSNDLLSMIDSTLTSQNNANLNHSSQGRDSKVSSGQTSPIISTQALRHPATTNRKYVLVVDDSSASSRIVTRKLEAEGYAVNAAYNGMIALDMLRKDPSRYGVVVADVVMPVMDGVEFLRAVKADINLNSITVIMLTGLDAAGTSAACLELGAEAILRKPLDENLFQDILIQKDIVKYLIPS